MPWINGRAQRVRLLLVGRVMNEIVECSSIEYSQVEFMNGIANAIAGIGGAMRVASI
jgi:hypothetical protein